FDEAARQLCHREPVRTVLKQAGHVVPSDLPRGALLGTVELDDCLYAHAVRLSPVEQALGDFRLGRHAWLLSAPCRSATPLLMSGRPGIFEVPDELLVEAGLVCPLRRAVA